MWFAALAMVVVIVAIAIFCHGEVRAAVAGEPVDVTTLFVPFAALFVVASAVVVVFQSLHVANRVVGPEQRIVQSLRRMRHGDLAFRVHLRRGDLLTPVARECNELLEWLNENPPPGASVGSDVVRMTAVEESDESAHTGALAAGPTGEREIGVNV